MNTALAIHRRRVRTGAAAAAAAAAAAVRRHSGVLVDFGEHILDVVIDVLVKALQEALQLPSEAHTAADALRRSAAAADTPDDCRRILACMQSSNSTRLDSTPLSG